MSFFAIYILLLSSLMKNKRLELRMWEWNKEYLQVYIVYELFAEENFVALKTSAV